MYKRQHQIDAFDGYLCQDLPDKGIRQKRQSDGRRQVFVHGRSIETRPESVKARQTFGHFEVDTMQSGKRRGDVLVLACHDDHVDDVFSMPTHEQSQLYRV
ncbi:hypothetical protein BMS83_10030 [Leuconostoc pseudomesenteroides]|nr:hypothetical protein BMS83_10030 [Leuconostoc pseudomesenteroides]